VVDKFAMDLVYRALLVDVKVEYDLLFGLQVRLDADVGILHYGRMSGRGVEGTENIFNYAVAGGNGRMGLVIFDRGLQDVAACF